MARSDQQCNFRIARENREWLESEALKNRRSLTAQYNWIIEEVRRLTEGNKQSVKD